MVTAVLQPGENGGNIVAKTYDTRLVTLVCFHRCFCVYVFVMVDSCVVL